MSLNETWPLSCVELLERYSSFGRWCQTVTGLLEAGRSSTRRDESVTIVPRGTARQLSADEVAELVAGYQAGASVYALAGQFKVHRTTVASHLHTAGVSMRHQGLDEDQIDEAVRLYADGLSLAKIGNKLGVVGDTVRAALLRRGLQMRSPHWRPGK